MGKKMQHEPHKMTSKRESNILAFLDTYHFYMRGGRFLSDFNNLAQRSIDSPGQNINFVIKTSSTYNFMLHKWSIYYLNILMSEL